MNRDAEGMDTPAHQGRWGSDLIADALREQKIPYVCLVPGASFRGLHDSIVNNLGNKTPKMIVCLHEEHSVAIAHGWAQVTNKPIAAITHTNVGLMHATMAIFNVWCDRAPALMLGAGGPLDAEKRRPWIDWIHSAVDQGALVREYTKWDDQPGSAAAAVESIRRGTMTARTAPMGPVYINLDVAIQEERTKGEPAHALGRSPRYAPNQPGAAAGRSHRSRLRFARQRQRTRCSWSAAPRATKAAGTSASSSPSVSTPASTASTMSAAASRNRTRCIRRCCSSPSAKRPRPRSPRRRRRAQPRLDGPRRHGRTDLAARHRSCRRSSMPHRLPAHRGWG